MLICFYSLVCTILFSPANDPGFANLGQSFFSLYAVRRRAARVRVSCSCARLPCCSC